MRDVIRQWMEGKKREEEQEEREKQKWGVNKLFEQSVQRQLVFSTTFLAQLRTVAICQSIPPVNQSAKDAKKRPSHTTTSEYALCVDNIAHVVYVVCAYVGVKGAMMKVLKMW